MRDPVEGRRRVRRLQIGNCGPVFLCLLSYFGKLLEIIKYLTCHSFYQLAKSQDLPNSFCQTVGDAQERAVINTCQGSRRRHSQIGGLCASPGPVSRFSSPPGQSGSRDLIRGRCARGWSHDPQGALRTGVRATAAAARHLDSSDLHSTAFRPDLHNSASRGSQNQF